MMTGGGHLMNGHAGEVDSASISSNSTSTGGGREDTKATAPGTDRSALLAEIIAVDSELSYFFRLENFQLISRFQLIFSFISANFSVFS